MQDQFERLEKELKLLKEDYERLKRDEYERKSHKTFKEGDCVKKGEQIGLVVWVQNATLSISEDMGYCRINIVNGRGGNAIFKRDEWELIEGEESVYLKSSHKVELHLTGEEIQYLLMNTRFNTSKAHNKFTNLLKEAGDFTL